MLFVVPTPIGHLKDISLRALEVLREVDVILAEDTRTTGRLLKHYDISKPLRSYHAHNEHRIIEKIIEKLDSGVSMALVSDAGMPGISDPGYLLIRSCVQQNVAFTVLPGPSAGILGLACSGLPMDRYFFEGFLPIKKGRQTRWKALAGMHQTIILYESPHRIIKCLKEIILYLGGSRQIAVCRELTKLHEEVIRGTSSEVMSLLEQRASIKGEFVVVISGQTV